MSSGNVLDKRGLSFKLNGIRLSSLHITMCTDAQSMFLVVSYNVINM